MYATVADLVLPQNFPSVGASTAPLNVGQVASIICEVSAELDAAAAAAGYAVPVAPPASGGPTGAFAQLAGYAKAGVLSRMFNTVMPNLGGASDKTSSAADYRAAYQNAVKDIAAGRRPLVGASRDTGETTRELPRSSALTATTTTVVSLSWAP